jgi:hypothetical protein
MHRPGSRSRPQPRTSRQSQTIAGELKEEKPSAGLGRSEPLRIAGAVVLVALWAANLAVDHSTVQTVLGFVLIAVLVQVTISDLEERRIKNRLTFPGSAQAAGRQSRWARSWRLEEWSRRSQDQVCIWPRNLKNLCL